MGIWESLQGERLKETPQKGIWQELLAKTDISKYVPRKIDSVEEKQLQSARVGSYFVVKNQDKIRYLKLSDQDYFLWQKMNGQSTFGELVMAYFQKFGSFAFNRINTLLDQLRLNYFLEEQPVRLFTQLRQQKAKQSFVGKMSQIARAFIQKQMPIAGLDQAVTNLYNKFFWPFFTTLAKWFYLGVSLLGFACFAQILHSGRFSIVETQGSYLLGVLILVVLQIFIILLHEGAHAFATKAYGRDVPRGGFMLYMGMPAFFVDTTDMWLESKGKRIAVSWAGPYSELVVGGLFSIWMILFPDSLANPILFKCVFLFYIGVFINMNPLLELDGYYILVDLLEIPLMRRRSFQFVKKELLKKIRHRASFSREEKIFSVFGLLAAAYTFFAIGAALYFWQTRIFDSLLDLWGKGITSQIFVVVLLVASLGPLVLFLFIKGLRLVRWLFNQITSNPIFKEVHRATPILGAVIFGLVWGGLSQPWFDPLTIQLGALVLILGTLGHFLYWHWRTLFPKSPWSGTTIVFLVALLVWCVFQALSIRGEDVFVQGVQHFSVGLLGLAALMSLRFWQKNWIWPILLLWGVFVSACFSLTLLGDGFLFLAILSFALAVQGAKTFRVGMKQRAEESDEQKLKQALSAIFMSFKQTAFFFYSKRVASFYWTRVTTLIQNQVSEIHFTKAGCNFQSDLSILEEARAANQAFEILWRKTHKKFGSFWSQLILAKTLDSLDWQQREILEQYLFKQADWKRSLVQKASADRLILENILKQNFLFADLSDEEISELAKHFQKEDFGSNDKIILQGDVGDKFYLIKSGTVLVRIKDEKGMETEVARLHEGDFFGEIALLKEVPRTATCLAERSVQVWSLNKESFSHYMKQKFEVSTSVERAIEIMRLLSAMPLFKELTPTQMRKLASRFTTRQVVPNEAAIRQGDPGNEFFVIEKGGCRVKIKDAQNQEKEVAKLGKGEYFGEMALLSEAPRSATVEAVTQTSLLVLSKEDFDQMIKSTLASSGGLEKVSSRRRLDLKKKALAGA